MKIKKISKKLTLNKETVSNLAKDEQRLVLGGRVTVTCPWGCQTNEYLCTRAGCITQVEPTCGPGNPCQPPFETMTACTFYCLF